MNEHDHAPDWSDLAEPTPADLPALKTEAAWQDLGDRMAEFRTLLGEYFVLVGRLIEALDDDRA